MSLNGKSCKYCSEELQDCLDEGFRCISCTVFVHTRCLTSTVPGGLQGDIFFEFKCKECSNTGSEEFVREKLSWLKVISLIFYHLQARSPGLGKKGFFHWRNHVVSFIDKNWDLLFPKEKKKKKWVGTVAGTLSHFSNYYFKSGTAVVNEPAWWALNYPKLTPNVIFNLNAAFSHEKQNLKIMKISMTDADLFSQVFQKLVTNESLSTPLCVVESCELSKTVEEESKFLGISKRKTLLPTFESTSKKLLKLEKNSAFSSLGDELKPKVTESFNTEFVIKSEPPVDKKEIKLLDPLCHYNTSLSFASRVKGNQMKSRLMGNTRKEMILSPYTGIYLKPYIRRDSETHPHWLKLMAEVQVRANQSKEGYVLPPRAPVDYTYVQPEHIPAINSLCNNFFWAGIDLTECLQYPDFSCVVMYKKLIVGFAFIVPNVTYTENYVSFIFTRPGWRNVGIGKFMLYHLIQTSLGKDITLHVSINNPALFLYQKFGFKVESVVLGFYEKYLRNEAGESKHAFFCRLER